MNEPNANTKTEPRSELLHFLAPDDLGGAAQAVETLLKLEHEEHCLLILKVPLYFSQYEGNPAHSCAEAVEQRILRVEAYLRGLYEASKQQLS